MSITRQPSRSVPCLDVLHQHCTVPAVFIHQSGSVLSVKYDMRTPLRWFILGSEGEVKDVKKTIRLKQFDICLICTQRGQDIDISHFKHSLAEVGFNISFCRIDSPAIRMQADKLFSDFFCGPSFYWQMPRLALLQSMPDLTSFRLKFIA